jgi:hypothetical protein
MKKDLMEDDSERDAWLGPMLRQTPLTAGDQCVDAETLAAWADGRLAAKEAAAVELHASHCSRCIAMLAAIERTIPPEPGPEDRSWAIAPLWRWIVPLTAAATAVAIWVVVPERPVTQAPATAPQEAARRQQEGAPSSAPPPPSVAPAQPTPPRVAPEPPPPGAAPATVPPSADATVAPAPPASIEPAEERSASRMLRDDAQRQQAEKRERAAIDAFGAPAAASALPEAAKPDQVPAPAPAPAPARQTLARPPAAAVDTLNQSTALSARQVAAPLEPVVTNTAVSPSDPLVMWRVIDWMSVERSIDGGSTWIKTALPPGVGPDRSPRNYVVSIRVVDNLRGVILTSDRSEFYTTNGGTTWERVQENSVAPF